MIKLQTIKPDRKKIDYTRFAAAAKRGLRDAAEDALIDMKATAASWTNEPTFFIKEQKDGYLIGTDDEIWRMLDVGTRAHRIVARRTRRLRFGVGGSPKTRPGFLGSTSGSSGSGDVFRRTVQHPGTKARSWSKLLGAKYRARLASYIDKRIREAL